MLQVFLDGLSVCHGFGESDNMKYVVYSICNFLVLIPILTMDSIDSTLGSRGTLGNSIGFDQQKTIELKIIFCK